MASFRRRGTPARAHKTSRAVFFNGLINAHFGKKEPFRDCDLSGQGGRLRFGVVNLFPLDAELDCHLNATFLERHERHLE